MSSTDVAQVPTAADIAPDVAALLAVVGEPTGPDDLRRGHDQLIAWLRGLGSPDGLPEDRGSWPCLICDAAPGEPCGGSLADANGDAGAERFHNGRGFEVDFTAPGHMDDLGADEDPADVCTPTVESGPGHSHRGRCLGCGWRGAIVDSENAAVELAHDHTHPGWRDLPVIDAWPKTTNTTARPAQLEKLLARWDDENLELLPDGWLDTGGPIVVHRSGIGSRHVPGRAPGGGYELAVGGLETTDDPATPGTDIVPATSTDVDTTPPAWESPEAVFEQRLFHEDGDMPEDLARQVVAKVGAYSVVVYRLLGRAHERRIWKALGHSSWAAFVEAEFDISRSRAYQLVHQYQANMSLGAGADTVEERALPPGEQPTISEAQARPMGTLASDERAVKQIWARATELAGGDEPTAAQVEEAVREYRNPTEFAPPAAPLVTANSVLWIAGPVWWLWTTPPEGTVLHVGLGEPSSWEARLTDAWFTSAPRLGDLDDIRRMDAAGLLPWVIAELLPGPVPQIEAARAISDLELRYIDRGPHELDRDEVVAAVTEGATTEWEDAETIGRMLDRPVPAKLSHFGWSWRLQSDDGGSSYRLDVWCDDDYRLWSSDNQPWDGETAAMMADVRTVVPRVMAEAVLGRAPTEAEVESVAALTLSWRKPKKKLDPFWINRMFIERALGLDAAVDQATDEDDEVLTGELVDRSAPEPSPPGGSAAATDAGGGGDVPPASPPPAPPSAEQVALAALRQEIPRMDVDELLELVGMAIGAADGTSDPADARWAAQVLRLAASRFETEAGRLDREGAA